jgi:hypothetical protein
MQARHSYRVSSERLRFIQAPGGSHLKSYRVYGGTNTNQPLQRLDLSLPKKRCVFRAVIWGLSIRERFIQALPRSFSQFEVYVLVRMFYHVLSSRR